MNLNLNRSYKTEKVYGFTARNLSLKYWNALHPIDLYKATYAKFKQNDILKQKLLSTGNQLLIQCDGIANGYGCGYFISRRGVANRGWRFPSSWMGKNLYGFILMDVREQIRIEEDDAYEGLKLTYELNKNFSWEVTRWDNPEDNSPFSPEYDGKKTLGIKQDDEDS